MKRLIWILTVAFCILLMTAIHAAAGEKVWVTSKDTDLKSARVSASETIASLQPGTELNVLSFEKRWYLVTTSSGKQGWIYQGKVSKNPPVKKQGAGGGNALGGLLGGLTGSSIKTEDSDATTSIRGLSPEAKQYAQSTGKSVIYENALDEVLAVKTDKSEIEEFLKNGRIGEYAE
ncbi:MAG: SH3 domain-containing protein [Pseudomonadota bacterium]